MKVLIETHKEAVDIPNTDYQFIPSSASEYSLIRKCSGSVYVTYITYFKVLEHHTQVFVLMKTKNEEMLLYLLAEESFRPIRIFSVHPGKLRSTLPEEFSVEIDLSISQSRDFYDIREDLRVEQNSLSATKFAEFASNEFNGDDISFFVNVKYFSSLAVKDGDDTIKYVLR